MTKQFLYKPNSEKKLEYINENIDSWTEWVNHNLKRCMKKNRFKKLNRISTHLLIIAVGILLSFIGMIVASTPGIIFSIFLLGGILVIYGVFSIIGVYIYG